MQAEEGMPMDCLYAKLAWRNVRRSVKDYSVYFLMLAFAACLLYSFTASGDYLLAMDLTEEQRGIYNSASMVTQAFFGVFRCGVWLGSRGVSGRHAGQLLVRFHRCRDDWGHRGAPGRLLRLHLPGQRTNAPRILLGIRWGWVERTIPRLAWLREGVYDSCSGNLHTSTQVPSGTRTSNSAGVTAMALLELPQAGYTVSKRRKDSSK